MLVLLAVRADLRQFFVDSFVDHPARHRRRLVAARARAVPAAGVRYYLPPVFYGFLLALAWKRARSRGMRHRRRPLARRSSAPRPAA